MRILLLLITLLGFLSTPSLADDFPEPPFKWVVGFVVEEIPGKGGLYFDIDGDKRPDLVTAHTLLRIHRVKSCPPSQRQKDVILIAQGCKSGSPTVYVLKREIFAVRMLEEKWAVVTERTWAPAEIK